MATSGSNPFRARGGERLFIRADASADIGTGHVMRCLALAQAWNDRAEGGNLNPEMPEQAQVVFVCASLPEALEARLKKEGCGVVRIDAMPGSSEDIRQTLAAINSFQVSGFTPQPFPLWFVADGYSFDLVYQRSVRAAGFKLLVMDDFNHLPEYECDLLLNQNFGAEKYSYAANADARRLLGPEYALLRREFRGDREGLNRAGEPPPVARNILVTMGGADLHGMTARVLAALAKVPGEPLHIRAVVGAAAAPSGLRLEQTPPNPHRIEWLRNVEDMPELMRWADLAVSAAGSTCWELLAMGVPMMLVVLASNQEQIALRLEQHGAAVHLGWHRAWNETTFIEALSALRRDASVRSFMIAAGRRMVDGAGAGRVAAEMARISGMPFPCDSAGRTTPDPNPIRPAPGILFLGPPDSPVLAWLRAQGEAVRQTADLLTPEILEECAGAFLVSHGYRHILRKPVLDRFPGRAINLHISYLPWNRGADPNLWSFLEDTPKGVTIHHLDPGVDTGDILVQRSLEFDSTVETLATSYARLQSAMLDLFKQHWSGIKNGMIPRRPQTGAGSAHRLKDKAAFAQLLANGWDTPVSLLERRAKQTGLDKA